MSDLENAELIFQLRDLADGPAPPPAFDAGSSIARARQRVRTRQRAAIGTAALATAALVTTGLLLEPTGSAAPVLPPAATASPAPTGPVRPALLTAEVEFGWLPDWVDGERGVSYASGEHGTLAFATQPGESGHLLRVSLLPAGREPALATTPGQEQAKVPAAPVGGRSAFWAVHPTAPAFDSGTRVLYWQTASGRWAELTASGGRMADFTDALMLRVASGVRTGERGVPLPFRLSGLPDLARATDAVLHRPAGSLPWAAGVVLAVGERTVDIEVAPQGDLPYGRIRKSCRVEQGLQICASTTTEDLPVADRFGGLAGLTALVHVTGADESTWTTDNLR
ncbi:hypothetical protein AB0O91_38420 [Kitasatospora sp. NPDC089797]|uniref:hypothetical protein n=1 Tax=Kitasatospora sp. NPDC089797 TaxID=3155298 RepID=UPI003446FFCC